MSFFRRKTPEEKAKEKEAQIRKKAMKPTDDPIWIMEGLGPLKGEPDGITRGQYLQHPDEEENWANYNPVVSTHALKVIEKKFGKNKDKAVPNSDHKGKPIETKFANVKSVGYDCKFLKPYLTPNSHAKCRNSLLHIGRINKARESQGDVEINTKDAMKKATQKGKRLGRMFLNRALRGGKKRKTRKQRKMKKRKTRRKRRR